MGAWGTTKVNRAARRLTPEGLTETAVGRAAQVGDRMRTFVSDVRVGMAEREEELNHTLGRSSQGAYVIRPGTPDRALPAPGHDVPRPHPQLHDWKEGH
ncbi:hypothetical protein AQ490_14830 [Wenjunlia vitaminophila]|uniref:Uncharacterized protein n=1 Tax=Wenjunlia vitaminophila TaxID=76728 RepID=A0A0T6LX05_WENVI|nr:hypothetical protein AQ490_14830 [Wenjunlia vitaminophila]